MGVGNAPSPHEDPGGVASSRGDVKIGVNLQEIAENFRRSGRNFKVLKTVIRRFNNE